MQVSKSFATTFGNLIALIKLVGDILLISMWINCIFCLLKLFLKFLSLCFLLGKRANEVKITNGPQLLCMKEISSVTSDCIPNLRELFCHFCLLESGPEM